MRPAGSQPGYFRSYERAAVWLVSALALMWLAYRQAAEGATDGTVPEWVWVIGVATALAVSYFVHWAAADSVGPPEAVEDWIPPRPGIELAAVGLLIVVGVLFLGWKQWSVLHWPLTIAEVTAMERGYPSARVTFEYVANGWQCTGQTTVRNRDAYYFRPGTQHEIRYDPAERSRIVTARIDGRIVLLLGLIVEVLSAGGYVMLYGLKLTGSGRIPSGGRRCEGG